MVVLSIGALGLVVLFVLNNDRLKILDKVINKELPDLEIPDNHLPPYQETFFWYGLDADEDKREFKAWYKGEKIDIFNDLPERDIVFPIEVIDEDEIAYYYLDFTSSMFSIIDGNYFHNLKSGDKEEIEILKKEDDDDSYGDAEFISKDEYYVFDTSYLPDYTSATEIVSTLYYVKEDEKSEIYSITTDVSDDAKEDFFITFALSPDKLKLAVFRVGLEEGIEDFGTLEILMIESENNETKKLEKLTEIGEVLSYDWKTQDEIMYTDKSRVKTYSLKSEKTTEEKEFDDISEIGNLQYNRVTGMLAFADIKRHKTIVYDTRKDKIVLQIKDENPIGWVGRNLLLCNIVEVDDDDNVTNKGLEIVNVDNEERTDLSDLPARVGIY